MGISSSGEMALLLGSTQTKSQVHSGTLARTPLVGGAPREVLENVQWADWSPDGTQFAVVVMSRDETVWSIPSARS
jgi:hypothetical protein